MHESELAKISPAKKAAGATLGEGAFPVTEKTACARLGIGREHLRVRRDYFLAQGLHWELIENRVFYSAIGLQLLVGTREAALPAVSEKNAATPARRPVALLAEKSAPRLVFEGKLLVWGMPGYNRRLLTAYLPGADPSNPMQLVTCLVQDNRNFLRGMALPGPGREVKAIPGREGQFELLGACPRWRGRW